MCRNNHNQHKSIGKLRSYLLYYYYTFPIHPLPHPEISIPSKLRQQHAIFPLMALAPLFFLH